MMMKERLTEDVVNEGKLLSVWVTRVRNEERVDGSEDDEEKDRSE